MLLSLRSGAAASLTLRFALLLALWLGTRSACAQTAPNWQSAIAVSESSGGTNSSYVSATAADGSGNVYVAGSFRGTVNFGAFTLTNVGGENAFVAKWSPVSGSFVWVAASSGHINEVSSLAVSGNSVYVGGSFYLNATFGNSTLTTLTPGTSIADVFVAKLTDAGSTARFEWAQQAGGAENDYLYSLAVSGSNVYLTGSFQSPTATFGATTLAKAAPTNFTFDGYVARLTDAGSTGTFAWAQRLGGLYNDNGRALAVSGPNVYLTGSFSSPTLSLGSLSLPNAGSDFNVYVAKFTDTGTAPDFAWVQSLGNGTGEYVSALAASGSNVYVTGGFFSPTLRLGAYTVSNSGNPFSGEVYLAKLTDAGTSGSVTWAQSLGGSESDEATALATNGSKVYLVGNFISSTMRIGTLTLFNNGSNGYPDIYATRLTDLGSSARFDWAQKAGGLFNDQAQVATLSNTTLYLGGFVYTAATFGNIPFTYPATSYVPFLAGIDDAALLAAANATPLPGLSLAPNPAHASTTVRLPAVPGATQATLRLLDALGRTVRTQQLPLSSAGLVAELLLQGLAPGLYHLQVQAGGQRASRTLAVE
ncbi:T9SS type A sorting domain-containing protein [Hymenobacter properus]|uniref:T9SS type A sorting domain-containing protein n=1 Tax=Hymenobacter properus TaxID=2791026 RepID=A0A931BG67_9BACT|nr:T9SS type A sorting domain-containing protein [Hymenobacter properus]MBF9143330.1 T9SS type A sorting domain-containing protein [Hymenobacter properus]MBR7722140.1 T9SS type A sorting domain-containing protein [Microvirga sp. SRT04]